MSNPQNPESQIIPGASPEALPEENASFGDMLSQYEQSHARKSEGGSRQLEGTVIAISGDQVFLDIGFKTEGVLPLSALHGRETVSPGGKLPVSVKGRNPEGYYELTRFKVERPTDWVALEQAFASKATIMGTVTAVVKGGLSVDVGVRAFMPASRSGVRDAADMEKLVGEEIRCRITKLDVADEDVVVDRRVVAEEEDRSAREQRYSEVQENQTVSGVVRSLADYGAFIDIGGVDGLLHVSDISWSRVSKPADVLSVGQEVEVMVLKIEPGQHRISLGLKQLQPHPWTGAAEKYKVNERVHGTVTRVVDFGAFVELEPGVEGLIHISELSWTRRIKRVSEVVKQGETVEAVVLSINPGERRIGLGLKQALGDPWRDVRERLPVGSVVEGPVTSMTNFGAFVQLAEGIEGMIHVSDISPDKRINHPQEVLKLGQPVKAQVLEIDIEKRRVRLGIKQMAPTSLDEYLAEHNAGDIVSGRWIEASGNEGRVELGEGIRAVCRIPSQQAAKPEATPEPQADISSLTSMLQARWKGGGGAVPESEAVRAGQVRSFRIVRLDPDAKTIELELA